MGKQPVLKEPRNKLSRVVEDWAQLRIFEGWPPCAVVDRLPELFDMLRVHGFHSAIAVLYRHRETAQAAIAAATTPEARAGAILALLGYE